MYIKKHSNQNNDWKQNWVVQKNKNKLSDWHYCFLFVRLLHTEPQIKKDNKK